MSQTGINQKWFRQDCYWCGDVVWIGNDYRDESGEICYHGEDSLGRDIVTCSKHNEVRS